MTLPICSAYVLSCATYCLSQRVTTIPQNNPCRNPSKQRTWSGHGRNSFCRALLVFFDPVELRMNMNIWHRTTWVPDWAEICKEQLYMAVATCRDTGSDLPDRSSLDSSGSLPTGRTFLGRPRFMRSPEDAGGGRVHARVALDARVLPQNPLCFRRALQGSPRPRGGFSRWYSACLMVETPSGGKPFGARASKTCPRAGHHPNYPPRDASRGLWE
jgi:hypothetical protein